MEGLFLCRRLFRYEKINKMEQLKVQKSGYATRQLSVKIRVLWTRSPFGCKACWVTLDMRGLWLCVYLEQ